ncbi:MAG TPA: DUF4282 domain-containing protein [Syntrophomonadaceae bacterium]|nr:DUF4282 domain-containing protein [Syntrophomonadaceae bacterium]
MQERGFWSQLFDFSFSSFVTLKVIKVLYSLWIAIGAIGALGMLMGKGVMPFGYISAGVFLLSLIWAVVFFFLWVIGGRVWMETIIVLFRIAENTSTLVRAGGGGRPESSEGAKEAGPDS